MKKYLLTLALCLFTIWLNAQTFKETYPDFRYWQVGVGLGELPMGGSFKPSITVGYHFNNKIYLGLIYQFKDNINRGKSSFNADATGLTGLTDSREKVGQRFMLQARYTPIKYAPYISFGVVFNDADTETMQFSQQPHAIGNGVYNTDVTVTQTRKAGWAPAIGLGYQFDFKRGFSINAEWTPGWFNWIAKPKIVVSSSEEIAQDDLDIFKKSMADEYQKHLTNLYKVFHFGVSYRF